MAIRIFVSHSSHDIDVVERLVGFVESALVVAPSEIRCSSLPGYKLAGGERTSETVRAEVSAADVLIAVITRKSFKSQWVCFEVGARWGFGRFLVPLLGPGIDGSALGGPLREYSALSASIPADLDQMAREIADKCGFELRPRSEYQMALEEILKLKAQLTGQEVETKVREFFRNNPDEYFQPGAGVGAELGLERGVTQEIAERLVKEGFLEYRRGQFGRIYRLSEQGKGRP